MAKKTAKKKKTTRKAARRPAKKAAKRTARRTTTKKKTTRRSTAKKKAPAKKAATGPKKITASATPRTRSQQITAIAEACDCTRKEVMGMFDALEQMCVADLKKCGIVKFMGLKMTVKKAPAKPKSERDADAAKAKEAARVAAREKAAAAAAAQVRTRCLFPNFSELPVASTASSRCRTTSTPSTWSSESLRVS